MHKLFNSEFLVSARKLLSIRLFNDDTDKRWQKSVKDEKLEILCVSQFTLYNRLKGNKPDFHLAMQGQEAQNLYNLLLSKLGEQYSKEKIKGNSVCFQLKWFLVLIIYIEYFRW